MAGRRKATGRTAPNPSDSGDIFAQLGIGDPEPAPDPAETTQTDTDSATLLARIAALEAERATDRQMITRLQSVPPAAAPAAPQYVDPKTLQVDFTNLPDPVADLAGYQRELAVRINGVMAAREHAFRQDIVQRNDSTSAADRLWADFTSAYGDWEDYPELVGAVAEQVASDAKRRGLDVHRYVHVTPEAFFRDVDAKLRERYGSLVKEEEASEEQRQSAFEGGPLDTRGQQRAPARREPARREVDPDDGPNRTEGIFGGLESGGRPSGSPTKINGVEADMVSELSAVQRKMGLF